MVNIFKWLSRADGVVPTPAEAISRYAHEQLLLLTEPHVPGTPVSPDAAAVALLVLLGNQEFVRTGMSDIPENLKMAASLEIAILQFLAVKIAASNVLGASPLYENLIAKLDRHIQRALPDKQDLARLVKERHTVYEACLGNVNSKHPGDRALRLGNAFCAFCGLDRNLVVALSAVGFFDSTRGAAQDLMRRTLIAVNATQ